MSIKVLLVDDDQSCIDTLKMNLSSFSFINIVGECNSAEAAIRFLRENEADLLFLDIEMDGISGLEFAKHLQTAYPQILIIFVTGHPGFAIEGYEAHPIDFLTKPINILRLEKSLTRVREVMSSRIAAKGKKIGIKIAGGIQIINVNDILYIEKQGRKISVVCHNNEIFHSNETMQNLEAVFSDFGFFRSHQSFLVPVQKIKAIYPDSFTRSYSIQLTNDEKILPLSRNKYNELKDLIEKQTKVISFF
ncbi:LytTR family DNA-binding domain-containing protein [Metabacillus fastidiosus]|uniref:LytTR family DNA-binding domain-containing protein n=1 Tax=Metabacillus fastidiosus TaxID=1458 RepID=A0ABU6NUG7_9BACI|nr:LytTR family DNA-binding domain-containing protein [Metabacillus fastidiosus]MED4400007.1 LytTR family DNA-binding domain-containing protein [Metabacillus fastidiosus]MED4462491.1 LytTR family DNA-binding domain-containing protein [Metabacillus fastidiosus]